VFNHLSALEMGYPRPLAGPSDPLQGFAETRGGMPRRQSGPTANRAAADSSRPLAQLPRRSHTP